MRFILLYKSIIKSFSKFCEATKNLQQVISLFTVNYLLYQEFNRTTDASQHITSFQALYKILFQCRAIFCAFQFFIQSFECTTFFDTLLRTYVSISNKFFRLCSWVAFTFISSGICLKIQLKLLIRKLDFAGVRGNVLNLFSSYLKNRKQLMSIERNFSSM